MPLQVLAVAFTEDAAARMLDYLSAVQPTYPVGMAQREECAEFLRRSPMDRAAMPRLVLIDRQGVERASLGWDDPVFQGANQTDPNRQLAALRAAVLATGKPAAAGKR